MEQTNKISHIYIIILYSCGFFLFLEWLYPLHVLGTTDHVFVFFLFALFCFLITYLQLHWIVGSLLKGLAFIFIIQGLFYSTSFFGSEWIFAFIADVQLNVSYIFAQDWHTLTGLFRTTLFLLLIWLMSYLLYYWFVSVKKVFIFSICTFIYVGMLDTFATYDGSWAIVRTFLLTVFAFGLTNLLKDSEKMRTTTLFAQAKVKWLIPLIALPVFAIAVGILIPKTEGDWQDPISHVTAMFSSNGEGSGGVGSTRKVGYGDNDEQLGGSFEYDQTVLFQASRSERGYFRVESKEEYTGKGWTTDIREDEWTYSAGDIPSEVIDSQVEGTEHVAHLHFEDAETMNKIVYPYGTTGIESDEAVTEFLTHRINGIIHPIEDDSITSLTNYAVHYESPVIYADHIEAISETTHEMHEVYTQLPDALPERVHDLAASITEGHETQYEKVQAVERYFREAGFTYETTDVPIPEGDTDYVDQFLFDTQAGYCDNFSTSMVVLLRAEDIPTRWVKGFTGGDVVQSSNDDGQTTYEVTNSNAHSWVEVYFAGIGWVPFEPTVGFSGTADIEQQSPEIDEDEELDPVEEELDVPELTEELEQDVNPEEAEEETVPTAEEEKNTFIWTIIGSLLVVLAIVGFIYRDRVITRMIYTALSSNPTEQTIERSMRYCLHVCKKKELTKKPAETLRSFAARVDKAYGTTDMTALTTLYEAHVYSDGEQMDVEAYKETWKTVMKQLVS